MSELREVRAIHNKDQFCAAREHDEILDNTVQNRFGSEHKCAQGGPPG